jgi:fatty acyl-ACP thioesterase A
MITMANILQEVASNHAVAMWGRSAEGFATDPALADAGLIFVMTRLQIQMDHYPRWGDVVEIETWFQEAGKLGAQRDWLINDKVTGQQLGRATSTWVMINMHTRRLSKMPEEIRTRCSWYQMQPAADAISKTYTRLKLPEPNYDTAFKGPTQIARRSDMDMNGHINNVTYLAWAMETVPLDVYLDCHLYQIEIDFKAECHSGDALQCLAERVDTPDKFAGNGAGPDAMAFLHALRRCDGECTELVRARTTWRVGN